jgi:hypothetical protein
VKTARCCFYEMYVGHNDFWALFASCLIIPNSMKIISRTFDLSHANRLMDGLI